MIKQPLFLLSCLIGLTQVITAQSVVKIQFQLDAGSELSKIKSATTLGIRGNMAPLSWEKTLPMTDQNGDGIFEAEVEFQLSSPNATLEYKYIYDNTAWETIDNRLLWPGRQSAAVDKWNVAPVFSPQDIPLISAQQLNADFAIAKKAYLTLHPGIDRYKSLSEVERHFDGVGDVFNRDMDYRQAYLNFSKMVAAIQCGHTYANFYNQSGLVQQLVFNQSDKLPFCFRIIDRQLVITRNLSENESFAKGTAILAINNLPVSQILDSLLTVVKADGDNNAKRIKDLEVTGFGRFESFDIYFPLFFPPRNNQYEIEAKTINGDMLKASISPVSRDERKKRLLEIYRESEPPVDGYWNFQLIDNTTAYLKLGTFVTWQMKMDWRDFLKKSFDKIKSENIKNLILDIRGNEGGNDEVIYELSKYLANKSVTLEPAKNLVRYTSVPAELAPYLSSWDNSFKDFSGKVKPFKPGYYELKNSGDISALAAQKKAFNGKTYVLIDAANSSATFYLAKILKDNQLATLVGQPTGGSQRGLNGGQTAFLRLPNSGIELDIPLIGTFYENKPAEGIQPDVEARMSIADVIAGKDAVLEQALALIREEK